jgi:probable F420-dependent oxidoreductase
VDVGLLIFATDYSIGPAQLARAAEDRGFSSLYFPEHTHIPTSRRDPWPGGAELPNEYRHTLDPFVGLAAAAAVTERLRIGTGICLVAQHDPIVLAKEIATLDLVSNGRFMFGIGVGWNTDEMEQHGVDPKRRRAVVREKILAMKALWEQEEASFEGEFVRFAPSWSWPKPVQRPHPPIWVGGMGEQKTLRIVAEHADGWNAFPLPVPQLQHKLDVLRGHCDAVGRDYDAIRKQLGINVIVRADAGEVEAEVARFAAERQLPPERARQMVMAGTPDEVAAQLAPYLGLGFDMFILLERAPLDHETLRLFMAEVAPRLRAAAGQAN